MKSLARKARKDAGASRSRRLAISVVLASFAAVIASLFANSPGAVAGAATPQYGSYPNYLGSNNPYSQAYAGGSPYPTKKLPSSSIPEGATLFAENCATCHGTTATGSDRAPNLVGLGAATVDFWLSTGRMPLADYSAQAEVKPPRFNRSQILAIVSYVNSLDTTGPGIPQVDLSKGNLSQGAELFAVNCASCHVITGVGDALANSTFAPSLMQATPTQIVEALRTGPGNMPRFSTFQLSPTQANSVAKYVTYLHHPNDAGGFSLGHVGPVAEGFVAMLVGVGGLLLVAYWIGDRSHAT